MKNKYLFALSCIETFSYIQRKMYGITKCVIFCDNHTTRLVKNPNYQTDNENKTQVLESSSVDMEFYKELARSWDGVIILTAKEEIRILISNSKSCCEQWGFRVDGKNYDQTLSADILFDKPISKVSWNHLREREEKTACKENHFACVDVFLGEIPHAIPCAIDVFCYHNGYYAHDVYTMWHNHKDEQEL
jgi:hypothetical protein